jgi:Mn2+/Fe2+ NRAMP family transporter
MIPRVLQHILKPARNLDTVNYGRHCTNCLLCRRFSDAKGFYEIIIAATFVGLAINFFNINPIKALVFTAVFNGVAAVPLIFIIARIDSSEKILGKHKGGILSRSLVWTTFAVMGLAVMAMFYTLVHSQK